MQDRSELKAKLSEALVELSGIDVLPSFWFNRAARQENIKCIRDSLAVTMKSVLHCIEELDAKQAQQDEDG